MAIFARIRNANQGEDFGDLKQNTVYPKLFGWKRCKDSTRFGWILLIFECFAKMFPGRRFPKCLPGFRPLFLIIIPGMVVATLEGYVLEVLGNLSQAE